MKIKILSLLLVLKHVLTANVAFAVSSSPLKVISGGSVGEVSAFLAKLASYLLYVSGSIAVLMIVVSGIRYIVSAGDPTQTENAKKTMLYAIVGLVIVALSLLIVNVLISVLSLSSQGVAPPSSPKTQPNPQSSPTNQQTVPTWAEKMKAKVIKPGGTIKKCSYNGMTAYSIPTGDNYPDAYNTGLYNESGGMICYIDGGITGRGNGKCPTFKSSTCSIIWTKS